MRISPPPGGSKWRDALPYDPLPPLLGSSDGSISFFARRDLLDAPVSARDLWILPAAQRILRRQKPDGSWQYPGGKERIRTRENYNQIETYRNLGFLVEQFGFDREHEAIRKAAEYLLAFQSTQGDLRGIYGDQYSPNYSAGITELLIKAGYEDDPRVMRVFEWLLSMRQRDGGWAIPLRTRDGNLDVISGASETLEPDRLKPFSHMATGVVLRAFAAHPVYGRSPDAQKAGRLLLSQLFRRDSYPDRAAPEYWLRFSFPFWFTDLISALDSLSLLGFSREEPQIKKALEWFVENQQRTGLWNLKILKGRDRETLQAWLALAICRIFKRFSDPSPRSLSLA